MDKKTWDSLNKTERGELLMKAGLPSGLSQLSWSGLQKSERTKLEKATKSKGKGWHEKQEDLRTEKGIEKKAPIHREVAIKKEASEANNTPMQKPVHEEKKEPPKEWKKPDMPHEWYEAYKLKYDPHLSHEAQTYFYEKKIAVGKKFFELPDEKVKKLTIAHEVGHIFEELTRELQLSLAGGQASKILGTMKGDYYDGFMGGYRPSEAYANAVAETYSRPEWVKKNHPEIYTLIIETVPADWKAAIEHFISESEGGAESEYRLDKSQEDGEFIATRIKLPYQILKINGSSIEYTSPSHEGHIMFQGREYAEGIQKALEDVTEVIRTMQDVLEKCPHIRAYYKFKLTDLKKDINFNKPYVNLVFGLRPVKEYFGRGSATVSARGIKFWWYSPEDSTKHFKENPYYSIEATPPATIAHEIAHTLGSNNEFIDPLATLVAFMFYTKHHEYMAENSFEYMSREIGRTTSDVLRGKLKRPAVTSEMLRYYYAENPLELAAVVGQYSREDSDKIWAFLAQEKKKAEMPEPIQEPHEGTEAERTRAEKKREGDVSIPEAEEIIGMQGVNPITGESFGRDWANVTRESWTASEAHKDEFNELVTEAMLSGATNEDYEAWKARFILDVEGTINRLKALVGQGKAPKTLEHYIKTYPLATEWVNKHFRKIASTKELEEAVQVYFSGDWKEFISFLQEKQDELTAEKIEKEHRAEERKKELKSKYFITKFRDIDDHNKKECVEKTPVQKAHPFGHKGIALFAHKDGKEWKVMEATTGIELARAHQFKGIWRNNTKEEIIRTAKAFIDEKTPEKVSELIKYAADTISRTGACQ